VLVTGASGTERERIAMALHRHCGKSVRSFVSRDAATVGSGLRQADGSTLFVDEIGAVSADARVEIFRALDTGEYQAIGETELRKADVRLIGATADRDALQSGWLDRLKLSVHAPGLGDRLEDIPLLMRDLLGERFHAVDPRLVDALIRHRFTDHIRELDRLTKLAVATSTGAEVALTTEVRAELQL
jgi:two-component system nitrogen regulation response regulator GlnG/two-component system response regulator HydG